MIPLHISRLGLFIIMNIVMFTLLLYLSLIVHISTISVEDSIKKYGVIQNEITLINYLNKGKLPTVRNLLIGLVFGVIFGFMDNFGLWIGLDQLQKYMPGGVKTKAALGNTYSDFLGATIGTFVASIVTDITGFTDDEANDTPIYVNTLGILLGCILGIIIGKLVTIKD